MSSMVLRITGGCRPSEDELFLDATAPASLNAVWNGPTAGASTGGECSLAVTPAGGTGVSVPIADWVQAMQATRLRATKNFDVAAVDLVIEVSITDAAETGTPSTNGGAATGTNSTSLIRVFQFPTVPALAGSTDSSSSGASAVVPVSSSAQECEASGGNSLGTADSFADDQ